MILIVALGNPGDKYQNSRHNIGWRVAQTLIKKGNLNFTKNKKFNSEICHFSAGVLLVKPQTFMNASGLAVSRLVNFYKIKEKDLWVIHDDIDLVLGKLKIVRNRGSAGHRGVVSIIQSLGTTDFVRFRLGVGHPVAGRQKKGGKRLTKLESDSEISGFVLSDFSPSERDEVKRLVEKTTKAVEIALKQGIEKAKNRFN